MLRARFTAMVSLGSATMVGRGLSLRLEATPEVKEWRPWPWWDERADWPGDEPLRDIAGATWWAGAGLAFAFELKDTGAWAVLSSRVGNSEGQSSELSPRSSSPKKGEVWLLLTMYGDSNVDVPGVVRSVNVVEGGADVESTMTSLGDTVKGCVDVCTGAG